MKKSSENHAKRYWLFNTFKVIQRLDFFLQKKIVAKNLDRKSIDKSFFCVCTKNIKLIQCCE